MTWPTELYGELRDGTFLRLRPLRRGDRTEWQQVRSANWEWLHEWEPTPVEPGGPGITYTQYLRNQAREAKAGRALPFAIEIDGRLVGAMNMSNITGGVFRSATVGYWVAAHVAGRGVAPMALAVLADHAIAEHQLHRVEVNIRPENTKSLAVVRKLRFRHEGLRKHFLHIDGAWRDHESFALTLEDLGGQTLVERLRSTW